MNIKLFKKIIYLLGDDVSKLPFIMLMFILLSGLDVAGIALIGPYVSLVINPDSFIEIEKILLSFFDYEFNYSELLVTLGLGLVLLFAFKSILAILINKRIIGFTQDQEKNLKCKLMEFYQLIAYSDFVKKDPADYIYNIQTLTAQYSQNALLPMLRTIGDLMVSLAIIAFLAYQDLITLITLTALIGGVILIYYLYFKSKVEENGFKANREATKVANSVDESLDGFKEIKILGVENYFYNLTRKSSEKYAIYNTNTQVIVSAPRFLLELLMVVFIVLMVVLTIVSGGSVSEIIPTLSIFAVAAIRLLPASNMLTASLIQLKHHQNTVDRLYKDIKKDKGLLVVSVKAPELCKVEKFKSLKLKNIEHAYSDKTEKILNNITITINSGESIGIMGESGSGKTTLIDVMLGLLDSSKGGVYYNDKLIQNSLKEWRAHIAYLPQETFIMNDKLKNNIALGVDENKIDVKKVWLALEQARLLDFVNGLAEGLDSVLGKNGMKISGGQKQRVALARAFYHDKDVLIMDESTSALDQATESEIVREIKALKGKKTVIVIAHRLSTLSDCDVIYKLKNGKVDESGRPDDIL